MPVTVVMKTKGIFGKIPPFKDLLKPGFMYGTWTEGFTLNPNVSGDNTLLYKGERMGRGLNLGLGDRSLLTFKMSLPTSYEEIKDFYDYIMFLCGKLEVATFDKNGESFSIADIPNLIETDMEESIKSLLDMEKKLENAKISSMYIFGATNPIALSREDLEAINGDMQKFSDFLNEKQHYKGRYVMPKLTVYMEEGKKRRGSFLRKNEEKDESYIGTYEVNLGEDLIFPLVARSLNKKESRVKEWKVKVKMGPGESRLMDFNDFVEKLDKSRVYDKEHIFINLKYEDI